IYEEQYKYKEAMEECLKAEQYSYNSTDRHKGLIQNIIGRLFLAQSLTEEARGNFYKSLNYFHEIGDLSNEIVIYNQIGNSFLMEDDIENAFANYDKCVELLQIQKDYVQRVDIMINLSVAYMVVGDKNRARSYLEEVLSYPVSRAQLARVYLNLAEINTEQSDIMYNYVEKALNLAEIENDLILLSNIYNFLSSFEESRNQPGQALDYYKKHSLYIREYLDLNFNESMLHIQNKYEVKELQNKNMNLTIRHQRLIILALLFVILLISYWVFIYRQKKDPYSSREKYSAFTKNVCII
ncbi:MAG: hypothetical protein LIP08_13315, partial [Bacteroides sp.]|nr:hypothetical protein [Bacteroides sp.]